MRVLVLPSCVSAGKGLFPLVVVTLPHSMWAKISLGYGRKCCLGKSPSSTNEAFLESSERHVDSEKDAETHEFKHWLKKNDMV